MARSPVSITVCSDGLYPRGTSLFPGGNRDNSGGGTDSLRYFNVGSGHGGSILITTNGAYNFGSRSSQASQHFTLGDRVWLNGMEVVSLESALPDSSSTTGQSSAFRVSDGFAARGAKAGRGGFAYESRGDTQFIGSPYPVAQSSTPDARTTGKMFFSYSMKHMGSLNKMRLSYYGSSLNPSSFVVSNNDTFEYGETFTGTKSGGGTFTGTILAVNTTNSSVMFIPDGSYSSTDNFNVVGAVITGNVSGASLTMISAGYTIPLANKPVRISTNNSATPSSLPEVAFDFITTSDSQFAHKFRRNPSLLDDQRPQATINQTGNEWETWSYQIDMSGAEVKTRTYRNSSKYEYTMSNSNAVNLSDITKQPAVILFAYDWGGSTNPTLIKARVKNTLLDYDLAGAAIGDGNTLAGCTGINQCGVTAWSEASATVIRNYGDIPAGANCYLYIRDSSGSYVNENAGLLIGVAP